MINIVRKRRLAVIEDAMKAVEAAEKNAAEKVQAAKAEAERIHKASVTECEQIGKAAEQKAKDNELSGLEASDKDREAAVEKAREGARIKADALKRTAEGKEDEAIDAVIDKLLN